MPWRPIFVPAGLESAVVSRLEAGGITAISWSNATVDVSGFEKLENVPLAGLKDRMAPADPRWDPWLQSLPDVFHPVPNVAAIYVLPNAYKKSLSLVGPDASPSQPGQVGPRGITGWILLGTGFVIFLFQGALWWILRASWWKRKRLFPLSAVVVCVLLGSLLGSGPGNSRVGGPLNGASALWPQHRWFQEMWPFGAVWSDWQWNTPWKYSSYERVGTRIVETKTLLRSPDDSWLSETWKSLETHSAARVLGLHHP